MADRNSSRLLGHKKFKIHYDGYWNKRGAVNVDNFIGKSKTLGSVDGDYLSFMDLEKDIRDICEISKEKNIMICCLIDQCLMWIDSDDLLLKLWEVMLPDDNNIANDEDIDETYEVITSALPSDVTNDGYHYSSSETESEEGADWVDSDSEEEEVCSHYYKMDTYCNIYEGIIYPIPDTTDWQKPSYEVKAPIISRGPGRPKRNRHKANDENEPVAIKRKCQNCGTYGHNKRTCKATATWGGAVTWGGRDGKEKGRRGGGRARATGWVRSQAVDQKLKGPPSGLWSQLHGNGCSWLPHGVNSMNSRESDTSCWRGFVGILRDATLMDYSSSDSL
ncbi:hypothetical protein LguiB_012756 [Lonicera macranthoides]